MRMERWKGTEGKIRYIELRKRYWGKEGRMHFAF